MRIYRAQELVGILVAPGSELVTEDENLKECLGTLVNVGEVSVQEAINCLNKSGFTVHGAYQMEEGPTNRERESQFFHAKPHIPVDIKITTLQDSKPKENAITDDAQMKVLRTEKEVLLEDRKILERKIADLEAVQDALNAEIAEAREAEADMGVQLTEMSEAQQEGFRWPWQK